MSLILSGTDGLSDVDGTAATPAIRGTDANTGIFFPAADTIAFAEGGAEAMRIDSSGRVLIGATSSVGNANANNLEITNSAGSGVCGLTFNVASASANTGNIYWRSNASNNAIQLVGDPITNYFAIATNGSERMRIDSSGYVGIGTSSPVAPITIAGSSNALSGIVFAPTAGGGNNWGLRNGYPAVSNAYFTIVNETSSTVAVSIDTSNNFLIGTSSNPQSTRLTLKYGTSANWGIGPLNNGNIFYVFNDGGTGVQLTSGNQAWAAQSDERVKTDLVPIENGLEKVATLRAVVGRLKNDDSGRRLPFLIAQDVKAVLPEAVDTGEDEDATLSLRYTDVIPLLVAAIKEQQTLITTLTDRITALETPAVTPSTGTQA
jgi:hypothetical protein